MVRDPSIVSLLPRGLYFLFLFLPTLPGCSIFLGFFFKFTKAVLAPGQGTTGSRTLARVLSDFRMRVVHFNAPPAMLLVKASPSNYSRVNWAKWLSCCDAFLDDPIPQLFPWLFAAFLPLSTSAAGGSGGAWRGDGGADVSAVHGEPTPSSRKIIEKRISLPDWKEKKSRSTQ